MKKLVTLYVGQYDIEIGTDKVSIRDFDALEGGTFTKYDEIEVELDFHMPSVDEQKQMVIKSLKQKKQELLADAEVRAEQIEEKIQSLMAIENE